MPSSQPLSPLAAPDPQPPLPSDRCTIVVPCFNEAKRLPVDAFHHFLNQQTADRQPSDQQVVQQDPLQQHLVPHDPVHLLFVNDGSTDQTLAVLRALQEAHPDSVSILDKQPNGGKAEAVRAGLLQAIAHASTGVCGFWDADLATPLDSILEMQSILDHRPQLEMVFGARVRLLGRSIQRKPERHYLGRIFATVVSTLLRVPIYDTQCGAKLFRITPDLKRVLAEPFHSRWIFDVELLARFLALHPDTDDFAHQAIYEYPLTVWHDVAGSRLRPGDFLKSIAELNHIRNVHLRRGRSPAPGGGSAR